MLRLFKWCWLQYCGAPFDGGAGVEEASQMGDEE